MNNILPILIGVVLAGIGCVLGWIIISRNAKHSRVTLLAEIERAEKELLQDLDKIGINNLQKTEAGRELLGLLGLKTEVASGAENPNILVDKAHRIDEINLETFSQKLAETLAKEKLLEDSFAAESSEFEDIKSRSTGGLRGRLQDFGIIQLLNLINLANKSGILELENQNKVVELAFQNGKLVYAQIQDEDNSLVAILSKAGKLSPEQAGIIRQLAGNFSDRMVGVLLVKTGYFTPEEISTTVKEYFSQIVHQVALWMEGNFNFYSGLLSVGSQITTNIELENLIIENSRLIEEQAFLLQEIPNLDIALTFTENQGERLRNLNFTIDEWKVIKFITPENSLQSIAKANKLNELVIRKIVYGLLQAGLVEVVRGSVSQRSEVGKNSLNPILGEPLPKKE